MKERISVSDLFLDKIGFTNDIPERSRKDVAGRFDQLLKDEEGLRRTKASFNRSSRYASAASIYVEDCDIALLQLRPYKPSNRFLRVEFNPHRNNPRDIGTVKRVLECVLLDLYPRVMEDVNITKFDA